jgi:hypothetical protein
MRYTGAGSQTGPGGSQTARVSLRRPRTASVEEETLSFSRIIRALSNSRESDYSQCFRGK